MSRNQPTPSPQLDPLSDLREPDLGPVTPSTVAPGGGQAETTGIAELTTAEPVTIRPMVDQDTWDEMVSETVAAWHADPTSKGFMHGGGQCGCWYLAKIALQVVPVMTDADLEEHDQESSGE